MESTKSKYIGIGLNNDFSKTIPVIDLSGRGGMRKTIHDVGGIERIRIYCIDFQNMTTENIGNVPWPDSSLTSDVVIEYEPRTQCGTVRITQTNQVWSYNVSENQMPSQPASARLDSRSTGMGIAGTAVVDRDKIRQLEQEDQVRILWPDELAEELKKEVFGQDEAIKLISEIVASNLRRKKPETEVIVLFGPTGVGKTETGKALPAALEKLTGRKYGFQQTSMNQYTEPHTLQQWFGSPPSYTGYKDSTIFEPCRENPYQVFLLDEIEKAAKVIWTGLMECFSNSTVKLMDNTPEIDLSHAIFILTSNIPVDGKAYQAASRFHKKEICRDALTRACGHPEFAGKIRNCLAYQSLPTDAVTDIVLKFVTEELDSFKMALEHIDEQLVVELKQMLKNSQYGARGIKDAVRTALSDITYDRDIEKYKNKRATLTGSIDNIVITVAA